MNSLQTASVLWEMLQQFNCSSPNLRASGATARSSRNVVLHEKAAHAPGPENRPLPWAASEVMPLYVQLSFSYLGQTSSTYLDQMLYHASHPSVQGETGVHSQEYRNKQPLHKLLSAAKTTQNHVPPQSQLFAIPQFIYGKNSNTTAIRWIFKREENYPSILP